MESYVQERITATNGTSQRGVDIVVLLKACAKQKDLLKGTGLHADILKYGLIKKSRYVASTLVSMYAKCGALAQAHQVLIELPARDVASWNALIAGYAQQGQGAKALSCFEQMQQEGLSPNAVTYMCILKACGSIGVADTGEKIHAEIVKQGLLEKNIALGAALVNMYARFGALAKAQRVLDELPVQDVVSWSALITGYVQHGQVDEALNCFEQMQHEGLSPDAFTLSCILKACGILGAADKGTKIHAQIAREGLLKNNIVLGNALVSMYAKCGTLAKAQQVLDELPVRDVVTWSAIIAGYAQTGQGEQALKCFESMQKEGLSPDIVTYICVLKACGRIQAIDEGEQIHGEIVKQKLLGKNIVLGTALVDMYAKCGAFAKGQRVLDELPVKNVDSWNALIAGYVQQGKCEEALICFDRMQCEGLSSDAVTFTCILKACSGIGAADKGEQIHDEIFRLGLLGKNITLGNTLVDMYAKCGALVDARRVLDELPVRNVVSWSALIAGYAHQGQSREVLNCLEWMQHEGLSPDVVTLACVLNVCSHSGLLDEGQMCFALMSTEYGITPNVEHHTCMVDLFGRAGHFDKALNVIKSMPSSDYLPVWSALLGACRRWGNVKLGKWAFEHAVQVDKSDDAAYVCMTYIYAAAGMQDDADKIEDMRVKLNHG